MNNAHTDAAMTLSAATTGFGVNKVVYTVLLAGLIGVLSSTVNFEEPSAFRLPVTGAIMGLILVMSGFKLGRISKPGLVLLLFWTGYATMCFISAIMNGDSILGEFWQLVGVPVVIFACIPNYTSRHGIRMVTMAIVLGFAPYIISSLYLHPLGRNYAGIFGNPNTMGIVLVAWLAGLLILLRGYLSRSNGRFIKTVFIGLLILIILFAAVMLLATSSRTSIGTAGALFLICIWTLYLSGSRKQFWLILGVTAIGAIAVNLLAVGGIIDARLLSGALEKFDLNLVSGRDEIWQTVVKEMAIFGHGNRYFPSTLGSMAHNNYMDILGAKGIIALAFRFCFDVTAVILACRLVVKRIKVDGYAAGPLLMIVNYMVTGLTETVNGTLGHGIHIAYLMMIGMLINANLENGNDGDDLAEMGRGGSHEGSVCS